MADEIYHQLAQFLDRLPAGYPSTESGLEIKILKRLFTPQEAALAMHLSLIDETARVIAFRAKRPVEDVGARLAEMESKGLIYGRHKPGQEPQYRATHFIVGIYEFQLNKMDAELAGYFKEYITDFFEADVWKSAPQLRTIPVGESIPHEISVMAYERAEELVGAHRRISLAPCVCRQEKVLLGEGCNKPMEACLSFGSGADYYVRNRMGRYISQEEALEVLSSAERNGLVLQPGASQEVAFICCCCGCCCNVLTNLKHMPRPADIAHTRFLVVNDDDLCDGCELCLDRCQMEALTSADGMVCVDDGRCLGCGLCVTTCPNAAMTLVPRSEAAERSLPKSFAETNIRLGEVRGVLSKPKLVGMLLRSKRDRMLAGGKRG